MTSNVMNAKRCWTAHTRDFEAITVVKFEENCVLDEAKTNALLAWLGTQYAQEKGLGVVLDMSNVAYLSSAGMGRFVTALKEAWRNDGTFKICSLPDEVKNLVTATGINRVLDIHDTVEESVDAIMASSEDYVV